MELFFAIHILQTDIADQSKCNSDSRSAVTTLSWRLQVDWMIALTAIVLRYSAHNKPRKTIKTIKTQNIIHKHNMTLIVSQQSIAVNK